jgi:hypothetical protein
LDVLFPTFEKYVLPVVQKLSDAFSDKSGGLGNNVKNVANALKSIFLPIWNGLLAAFNSVKGAVMDNLSAFTQLGSYTAKYLAPVIGTVLGGAFNIVGKIASGIITLVGQVVRVLNGLIGGAIDGINALIKAYNFANNIFGGKDISLISKPSLSVGSTSIAGVPAVSTNIPSIPTIKPPSGSGGGGSGGGGGGGGGGLANAVKSAASTAVASAGLTGANISGVNTSSLAGIMAASGPTYNINVTGAIDKEGVARQIVEIINESSYRGTGGSGAFAV